MYKIQRFSCSLFVFKIKRDGLVFVFFICYVLIFNFFSAISRNIGRLRKLRILDLSGNKIESIPEQIASLGELRELYLKDNSIETFTEGLIKLRCVIL